MKRLSILIMASLMAAAAFAQAPTITAVLDAGAYTANLAPGIVFVVKGTNLCGTSATASAPTPYSTAAMGGASISLTPVAGGAALGAYMVYCYNSGGLTQLAAELPNSTPPGDYNVTVTSNGNTSAAFKTTVVARKFEILTLSGSGSGRGTVTDANYQVNSFTTSSGKAPARPTGALIVWGTGLGAALGYDATAPPALDFLAQGLDVKAIVGGVEVTPFFAGRNNVYPGLDNIGVPLPANVPTGCTVSFQIRVAGQVSNLTTIAIAPDAAAAACVDPQYSPSVLSKLDSGGTVNIGYFGLTSFGTNISFQGQSYAARIEAASGGFAQYTADTITQVPSLAAAANGACYIYSATSSSSGGGGPVSNLKYLDAGALSLNGPNVSNKAFTETKNVYSLSLGTAISIPGLPPIPGFNSQPLITAGTYTLTGAGGADVGAFNSSITVHQPLTVTGGLPSTVNRAQNLTLNWTGSGSTDVVYIGGTSTFLASGTVQNGTYNSGTFTCLTTGDKQTFTVPSAILQQLPPTPANAATGTAFGTLEVFTVSTPTTGNGLFTAPLTAGGSIDFGLFTAGIGSISSPTTYQ